MCRNDYSRDMEERCKQGLLEQPPLSVEEFMKQCNEGKTPEPNRDPAAIELYRQERNKRLSEALSKQSPMSQEEAYAQYDRLMGVTSPPLPTTKKEKIPPE
jgi:hypothetical protein